MKKIVIIVFAVNLYSAVFSQTEIICSDSTDFLVPTITKEHPRLWYSNERLEDLRICYDKKKEPFFSILKELITNADNALSYSPHPYDGIDQLEFRYEALKVGKILLDLALAYQVTQNEKYAEAAIDILNKWISHKPIPGSTFEINPVTIPGYGMDTALPLCIFLQSCDLLYNSKSWNSQIESQFDKYLEVQKKNILQNIKDWSGYYKPNPNGEGYIPSDNPKHISFGGQLWNNHNSCHTMGIAAIAYYKGDRQLAQYALDCNEHIYSLKNMINNAILVPGDPGIEWNKDSASIQAGEIYDRYRHFDNGQGLFYACWHTRFLLNIAELAYQNGLNVYNYKSDDGKSLELPLNFYAKLFVAGPNEAKKGFYNHPREVDLVNNIMDSYYVNSIFITGRLRYPNNPIIKEMAAGINRNPPNKNFKEIMVGSWILCSDIIFE